MECSMLKKTGELFIYTNTCKNNKCINTRTHLDWGVTVYSFERKHKLDRNLT